MTLIRKIAFTIAASGLMVAAPMASAKSTWGSVPAFKVQGASQNNGNGFAGAGAIAGIAWPAGVAALVAVVTGGIVIGSGSR